MRIDRFSAAVLRRCVNVIAIVSALIFWLSVTSGADQTKHPIRKIGRGDELMLAIEDVALRLGYESKVRANGKLVVLCRTGSESICIPIPLTPQQSSNLKGVVFVRASLLERALSLNVLNLNGGIEFEAAPASLSQPPAYISKFGAQRGFRRGDTLPDIPLTNMQGEEVRFSAFLGKRYILYCWASW